MGERRGEIEVSSWYEVAGCVVISSASRYVVIWMWKREKGSCGGFAGKLGECETVSRRECLFIAGFTFSRICA